MSTADAIASTVSLGNRLQITSAQGRPGIDEPQKDSGEDRGENLNPQEGSTEGSPAENGRGHEEKETMTKLIDRVNLRVDQTTTATNPPTVQTRKVIAAASL